MNQWHNYDKHNEHLLPDCDQLTHQYRSNFCYTICAWTVLGLQILLTYYICGSVAVILVCNLISVCILRILGM